MRLKPALVKRDLAKARAKRKAFKGLRDKMDRVRDAGWWAKNGLTGKQAADPKSLDKFALKLDKFLSEKP